MRRSFKGSSLPATAIAFISLLLAMGGSAFAGSLITSSKIKDGTIQLKDINKKTRAKLKGKTGDAGARGPAGAQGAQGERGPAGPVDTSALVKKLAQSGETLTGEVGIRFPANIGFAIVSGSYSSRLPEGTPTPTLDIVSASSPTSDCPGLGQSTSGRLCVYVYNSSNFNQSYESLVGGSSGTNSLYGWSMEVEITSDASPGYMAASWAYMVP
jgi:hypothetical protein